MSENTNHEDGGTFAGADIIDVNAGNSKFIAIQTAQPNHRSDGQIWVNDGIDPSYIQYWDTTNADWKPVRPVTYEAVAANTYPTKVESGPTTNGDITVAYTAPDTYLWIKADGRFWTIKSG